MQDPIILEIGGKNRLCRFCQLTVERFGNNECQRLNADTATSSINQFTQEIGVLIANESLNDS